MPEETYVEPLTEAELAILVQGKEPPADLVPAQTVTIKKKHQTTEAPAKKLEELFA